MPEGLELVDFEWDSGNLRHILSDSPHGLTPALCHQIRDGMPRIFEARKGPGRSASHMIIGPDDDQRFWTIIVVYKRARHVAAHNGMAKHRIRAETLPTGSEPMTGPTKKSRPTDQELAKFHEAHGGDVSIWEPTPVRIRVRRGGPTTVFSLRLTPEELAELYKTAEREGVSTSEYIRHAALESARSGRPSHERELERSLTSAKEAVERALATLRE